MNKALALLVALAAGAQANVCNSGCDWNALAANAEAPTATCGGRITWLQNNRAMSAAEACLTVAGEFPSICGSCAPQTPSLLAVRISARTATWLPLCLLAAPRVCPC